MTQFIPILIIAQSHFLIVYEVATPVFKRFGVGIKVEAGNEDLNSLFLVIPVSD